MFNVTSNLISNLLLLPLVALSLLETAPAPVTNKWTFTSEDYFHQFHDNTTASVDLPNFGLNPEYSYESLLAKFEELNKVDKSTQYKLVFWARHGEGYHNLVKNRLTAEEWENVGVEDRYGNITLKDADLTPAGIEQTKNISVLWEDAISNKGVPRPQSYYVSPLRRTLHTFRLTWGDITAVVKENVRERYGKYTSYWRHSRTWIEESYAPLVFDGDFTENDELWTTKREKKKHVTKRVKRFLTDLFENDKNIVISVTTHSKTVNHLLSLINHPEYSLEPGHFIPTVIKAVNRENARNRYLEPKR